MKEVTTIKEVRNDRDQPMRRSLSAATFKALDGGAGIRSYAIMVSKDDGSVEIHWDSGGDRMRMLGALDTIHARVLAELECEE